MPTANMWQTLPNHAHGVVNNSYHWLADGKVVFPLKKVFKDEENQIKITTRKYTRGGGKEKSQSIG